MYLAVEAAYALQWNTPILVGSGRPSAAVDQTTISLREVSRFYPVIPPVPLISPVLTRTKPNLMILLRAQPDPTIPMNNSPSFSRRLAGATRTPPKPPDSPRSRPRPLVSSNGNPTSHAELGPARESFNFAPSFYKQFFLWGSLPRPLLCAAYQIQILPLQEAHA